MSLTTAPNGLLLKDIIANISQRSKQPHKEKTKFHSEKKSFKQQVGYFSIKKGYFASASKGQKKFLSPTKRLHRVKRTPKTTNIANENRNRRSFLKSRSPPRKNKF